MKKIILVLAFCVAADIFAATTVANVTARQRYPWNGKVDIDYEIQSDKSDATYFVYPKGVDGRTGTPILMRTLSGEGATDPVGVGKHRLVWDAKADMPAFHTPDFTVTLQVIASGAQYLVVDLSGGPNAVTYPVRYSTVGPDVTEDKCRTTELWLRLIMPGTFQMGSPNNESGRDGDEQQHQVTLSRPYYIGVFEVTQKQWLLMGGSTECIQYAGDCRPVDQVTYAVLRGSVAGAQWPKNREVDEDSFLGVLRRKTSLMFDLPTEAQWEYACRAGTTTHFNNGKNAGRWDWGSFKDLPYWSYDWRDTSDAVDVVGRARGNYDDGHDSFTEHTKVGLYVPNAWGLYDMHGNVAEPCIDAYKSAMGFAAVVDPVGAESTSSRIAKGGAWNTKEQDCRSAARWGINPSSDKTGVRLVCVPVE